MTDIHCHILPGVDDGAGNISDSVEMALLARSCGIDKMIVTPHCNIPDEFENLWGNEFEERLSQLRETLKDKNIKVQLYSGQEVFLASGYMELLREGKLITLNRSRYLLSEFPADIREQAAYRKIKHIVSEGYVPIIAHPERYGLITENRDVIYRLKEYGALFQLNKGSLTGRFGTYAKRNAERILRHHLADFIASDAHSQYTRTPYITDVHELVCEKYSSDYAELLFEINPEKVINDELVYSD